MTSETEDSRDPKTIETKHSPDPMASETPDDGSDRTAAPGADGNQTAAPGADGNQTAAPGAGGNQTAAPGAGQTRYARNGDFEIVYEDLGGAGGDPLLLVMGLGVSRFWWPQGFVDELIRHGFHVVAFDQRDAGESTRLPDTGPGNPIAAVLRRRPAAYTAEDMTDDAVAVLDALGWDSAHLFGTSMGGQLVQRIALRHPTRVRSITSSASLLRRSTAPGSSSSQGWDTISRRRCGPWSPMRSGLSPTGPGR